MTFPFKAFLKKSIAISFLPIFLTACDSGGVQLASEDVSSLTGAEIRSQLGVTERVCVAAGDTLQDASQQFNDNCGTLPQDCDPLSGYWVCSSEIIGAMGPDGTLSCQASGATLSEAQSQYDSLCSQPVKDCDPQSGIWQCSSGQIGSSLPDAEFTIDPVAGNDIVTLGNHLRSLLEDQSGGMGLQAFVLPESDDLAAIPQDPVNPLTAEKVALGQLLYHDTAFSLEGVSGQSGSWSCASCHHAAAGFKAGIPQGIGEGGTGFGVDGSARTLQPGFDGNAPADAANKPDVQPLGTPTILNSAYQDVMLWNGQFGNSSAGNVNAGLPAAILNPADTPKVHNVRRLSGLETQAIAGTGVHRLNFSDNTPLQDNPVYRSLWQDAFGDSVSEPLAGAGLAIAAYERTVLANRAPFQEWLRGNTSALDAAELRGGLLFFGKAGCVDCHRGPALSSELDASVEQMFFAVGFADFDTDDSRIHGTVSQQDKFGRGGFTTLAEQNFKFKIPPLYNLADNPFMGHGASFTTLQSIVEYKNEGIAQNPVSIDALDARFRPLGLNPGEISDLVAFLENALRDPDLLRYQPDTVPSGNCIVVDPLSELNPTLCP